MKSSFQLITLILFIFFSCVKKQNSEINNVGINTVGEDIDFAFQQIKKQKDTPVDSLKSYFQLLADLFSEKPNNYEHAIIWYQRFIEHFDKHERAKGHINRMVGKALCSVYDFDSGIPYLMKSTENFIKSKDYNSLSKSYNTLALAYHDFADYKEGIAFANLALKTINDHPDVTDPNGKWYAYNNLGINYDDSKQYEKAIENHLKAIPYGVNKSDSSYSYNNLGNTYKKLKHYQQSEKYFTLSLALSEDFNDTYHFATLYSNLMDISRLNANYIKAEQYLDSADLYSHKSNSPEKLIDFYYYAYQLKNENRDYLSGSNYLEKHVKLKDSLFSAEKATMVYDFQVKYETEKKERQIAKSKFESKQKSFWLILLGGGIIIGLVIFRNYKTKTKQRQQQLALENQLLKEQTNSKMQEQRLGIAKDLHDSLGAQLTFIHSMLDGLKKGGIILDHKVNQKLNILSHFTENSISELKNALWVLNSKDIRLEDLKLKILNFMNNAADAKEDVRFEFNFQISENKSLKSKQVVHVFRAVQEIINNALKYADASEIKLEIEQKDKELKFSISDNGRGFDVKSEVGKSYGLQNIQSRIAAIQGKLTMQSSPGIGTQYYILIEL